MLRWHGIKGWNVMFKAQEKWCISVEKSYEFKSHKWNMFSVACILHRVKDGRKPENSKETQKNMQTPGTPCCKFRDLTLNPRGARQNMLTANPPSSLKPDYWYSTTLSITLRHQETFHLWLSPLLKVHLICTFDFLILIGQKVNVERFSTNHPATRCPWDPGWVAKRGVEILATKELVSKFIQKYEHLYRVWKYTILPNFGTSL